MMSRFFEIGFVISVLINVVLFLKLFADESSAKYVAKDCGEEALRLGWTPPRLGDPKP